MTSYKLISTKGTKTIDGSETDAIAAAKIMEESLQPAFGVTVEDAEGDTVAEVRNGEVIR